MKGIIAVSLALFLAGCLTLQEHLTTPKGAVYAGMSSDAITGVLGEPQSVGRRYSGAKFDSKFPAYYMGPHTIEWAWEHGTEWIVAYLERGMVHYVGRVPKTRK